MGTSAVTSQKHIFASVSGKRHGRRGERPEDSTAQSLGDVIYAIRYRIGLPARIKKTQPKAMEWVIGGAGRSQYIFKLVKVNRILPNLNLIRTLGFIPLSSFIIPDSSFGCPLSLEPSPR